MASVDKFGRHSNTIHHVQAHRGPKGQGFNMTADGDYDMQSKRICNLKDAESPTDAVNLQILKIGLDKCVTVDAVNEKLVEVRSQVSDVCKQRSDAIENGLAEKFFSVKSQVVGDFKSHFETFENELESRLQTLQTLTNQLVVVENDSVRFSNNKKRIVGVGASVNKNDVIIREELQKAQKRINREFDDVKINVLDLKRTVDGLVANYSEFKTGLDRYTSRLNPRLDEIAAEIIQLKQRLETSVTTPPPPPPRG